MTSESTTLSVRETARPRVGPAPARPTAGRGTGPGDRDGMLALAGPDQLARPAARHPADAGLGAFSTRVAR